MIRNESWCSSCGLNCQDDSRPCRYYNVRILECDNCRSEVDKLYRIDGGEYCDSCALERLEVVE